MKNLKNPRPALASMASMASPAAFTAWAAFAALALPGAAARADAARTAGVPLLPAYKQECAACHVAYPPGLLPAASWQRLMSHLPQHFGTDASLDAATLKDLSDWLAANAGTSKRVRRDPTPPPDDRITRSAWFQREHREIGAGTWKLAAQTSAPSPTTSVGRPPRGLSSPAEPALLKSPSNCAACHTRADQGAFNEHDIRIPR